jgi:hypothetical protein
VTQEQLVILVFIMVMAPVGMYWCARICAQAYFTEKMKYHKQLLRFHEPIKEEN